MKNLAGVGVYISMHQNVYVPLDMLSDGHGEGVGGCAVGWRHLVCIVLARTYAVVEAKLESLPITNLLTASLEGGAYVIQYLVQIHNASVLVALVD